MICSLGGPLLYGSPTVVFLDHGHPCFWNFYSADPVDVVRMNSGGLGVGESDVSP